MEPAAAACMRAGRELTCSCVNASERECLDVRARACVRARMRACVRTHACSDACAHACVRTHACAHASEQACACARLASRRRWTHRRLAADGKRTEPVGIDGLHLRVRRLHPIRTRSRAWLRVAGAARGSPAERENSRRVDRRARPCDGGAAAGSTPLRSRRAGAFAQRPRQTAVGASVAQAGPIGLLGRRAGRRAQKGGQAGTGPRLQQVVPHGGGAWRHGQCGGGQVERNE